VYVKTGEYGMIAKDQDMSGGAHSDHHPLMTGLEPDTLYHYRVQGASSDGTIYVGEDRTFRTARAEGLGRLISHPWNREPASAGSAATGAVPATTAPGVPTVP
jgi:hypothetical protein